MADPDDLETAVRSGALRSIVCDDRSDGRRSLTALCLGCGLDVVEVVSAFSELVAAVPRCRPDLVLLTAPAVGLGAVGRLCQDAPDCRVVLVTPFPDLADAALQAGAVAVVDEDDLTRLRGVLLGLAEDPA